MMQDSVTTLPGAGPAEFVIGVSHEAGYTGTGVTFSVPNDISGICSFSPNPVVGEGGTVLRINTSNLVSGTHEWEIQASDGSSVGLPLIAKVDIPTVDHVAFYHNGTAYSGPLYLTNEMQGEVSIGYRIVDTEGNDIPADGCDLRSNNHDALAVLYSPNMRSDLTYAVGDGSAILSLLSPMGEVMATSHVHVALSDTFRVTDTFITPSIVDNAGGVTVTHQGTATSSMAGQWIGYEGMLAITNDNTEYSNENKTLTRTFEIFPGTSVGTYLFHMAYKRYANLTVVNSPSKAQINAALYKLDDNDFPDVSGYFYLYDATTETLLYSNHVWSMSSEFNVSYLTPGSYRARFADDMGQGQWYPNADSYADASVITLSAGESLDDLFFFSMPPAPTSAALSGVITYVGDMTGSVHVICSDTASNVVGHTVLAEPGVYQIRGVPLYTDVQVSAFIDSSGDGNPGMWDARGEYPDGPFSVNGDACGINFTCRDPDTDGDGLSDYYETYVSFTSTTLSDTDSDGMPDGVEIAYGYSPTNAATDGDGDDLADEWETAYDLSTFAPTANGRDDDADGDGLTNWQEMMAGTNPTNSTSSLKVTNGSAVDKERDMFTMSFSAVPGRHYVAKGTANFTDGWRDVSAVVEATGDTASVNIPLEVYQSIGFYRIQALSY
jgi:hypothetical protein